jgi:hypothetical protein
VFVRQKILPSLAEKIPRGQPLISFNRRNRRSIQNFKNKTLLLCCFVVQIIPKNDPATGKFLRPMASAIRRRKLFARRTFSDRIPASVCLAASAAEAR